VSGRSFEAAPIDNPGEFSFGSTLSKKSARSIECAITESGRRAF
jgi:hypothetical protein